MWGLVTMRVLLGFRVVVRITIRYGFITNGQSDCGGNQSAAGHQPIVVAIRVVVGIRRGIVARAAGEIAERTGETGGIDHHQIIARKQTGEGIITAAGSCCRAGRTGDLIVQTGFPRAAAVGVFKQGAPAKENTKEAGSDSRDFESPVFETTPHDFWGRDNCDEKLQPC